MTKNILTSFALSLVLISTASAGEYYGEKFDTKANATDIAQLLGADDKKVGKDILVTGKIGKVCQSSGCWFEFSGTPESTRVTFKDYSFTIPKDSEDKTVLVHGQLVQKEISVSAQKHYLKDAGASKKEISAIKSPKKVYEFVADGVYL